MGFRWNSRSCRFESTFCLKSRKYVWKLFLSDQQLNIKLTDVENFLTCWIFVSTLFFSLLISSPAHQRVYHHWPLLVFFPDFFFFKIFFNISWVIRVPCSNQMATALTRILWTRLRTTSPSLRMIPVSFSVLFCFFCHPLFAFGSVVCSSCQECQDKLHEFFISLPMRQFPSGSGLN